MYTKFQGSTAIRGIRQHCRMPVCKNMHLRPGQGAQTAHKLRTRTREILEGPLLQEAGPRKYFARADVLVHLPAQSVTAVCQLAGVYACCHEGHTWKPRLFWTTHKSTGGYCRQERDRPS